MCCRQVSHAQDEHLAEYCHVHLRLIVLAVYLLFYQYKRTHTDSYSVPQEMQKAGISPNVVTCNCLLSACAKGAFSHGLVMVDNGLELLQALSLLALLVQKRKF